MANLNFGRKLIFILLLILSLFNFGSKVVFLVHEFQREESRQIYGFLFRRENYHLALISSTKKINFGVNSSIWWWLFLLLNIHKKSDFWVHFMFFPCWFFFLVFEWFLGSWMINNRFYDIYEVFSDGEWLENEIFGKKIIFPDFLATFMVVGF